MEALPSAGYGFSELGEFGAENFSGAIHSTFPALVLRDVGNVLVVSICTINFPPGFSSADAPHAKTHCVPTQIYECHRRGSNCEAHF